MELCQLDKIYVYNLTNYNRIIAQRNKLLKIYHPDENIDESICLKYSQKINEAYKVLKKKLKG